MLIAEARALPPLAEPEFADGTISPEELSARQELWAAAEVTPCPHDLEIARLRAVPQPDGEPALDAFVPLTRVGSNMLALGSGGAVHGGQRGIARLAGARSLRGGRAPPLAAADAP